MQKAERCAEDQRIQAGLRCQAKALAVTEAQIEMLHIFPAMDGLDQQKGRQPHQEARRKDPAVLRVQRRAQQPAHGHARRQHQRVHGGEDHRMAAALGKAHFPHVGSAFHHRDETVCASGAQQQHRQY